VADCSSHHRHHHGSKATSTRCPKARITRSADWIPPDGRSPPTTAGPSASRTPAPSAPARTWSYKPSSRIDSAVCLGAGAAQPMRSRNIASPWNPHVVDHAARVRQGSTRRLVTSFGCRGAGPFIVRLTGRAVLVVTRQPELDCDRIGDLTDDGLGDTNSSASPAHRARSVLGTCHPPTISADRATRGVIGAGDSRSSTRGWGSELH